MVTIEELDTRRQEFLRALYQAAKGSPSSIVELDKLADSLSISFEDAVSLLEYWTGRGCAKRDTYKFLHITHLGVRVVEDELRTRSSGPTSAVAIPAELAASLELFRQDFPARTRTAFLMMRFGRTSLHQSITEALREVLATQGITGLRADDKSYSDDLFANVRTYMHGCSFGIAIFERIEADDFNPNVSLEVGYLLGLGKPVLLLKDRTLKTLHSDLAGRLYVEFDPHDPRGTIPNPLARWLRDKGLLTS